VGIGVDAVVEKQSSPIAEIALVVSVGKMEKSW